MTVQNTFPVALALVLGAALVADSEPEARPDEELRQELAKLRERAAQLQSLHEPRAQGGNAPAPPAAENGFEPALIPLEDLTLPITEFPRPYRGAFPDEEEPSMHSGQAEVAPQIFGTIEEVTEFLRTSVRPDAWRHGLLAPSGKNLIAYQKPAALASVRAFLEKELRPRAARTVAIDAEFVTVGAEQAAVLRARVGRTLDDATYAALANATCEFAGRVLGLNRQTVVLWHGRQAAHVVTMDGTAVEGQASTDPVVDIAVLGSVLQVSATNPTGSSRVQLRYTFEFDRNDEPVRDVSVGPAGTVQLSARDTARLRGVVAGPRGRWIVAGKAGARRYLLLRARVFDRKDGRR